MQKIRITTPQNIDIDYKIAGLGERIVARLIDYGIFMVLFLVFVIIASLLTRSFPGDLVWTIAVIIWSALFIFYDLVCELFYNGQSVGKKVMKIKVISLDGAQATMSQYLLRWLFRLIDFGLTSQLGGLITVAVSEKNQRIGDLVAGTTLVSTHPRSHINQLVLIPVQDAYEPVFPQVVQLSEEDIALAQEVIYHFIKNRNNMVVYNLAINIQQLLDVKPTNMNEMVFLQTIIKDYNHLASQVS